jgi:hypothetical protein
MYGMKADQTWATACGQGDPTEQADYIISHVTPAVSEVIEEPRDPHSNRILGSYVFGFETGQPPCLARTRACFGRDTGFLAGSGGSERPP